jgi:hypothetical protein
MPRREPAPAGSQGKPKPREFPHGCSLTHPASLHGMMATTVQRRPQPYVEHNPRRSPPCRSHPIAGCPTLQGFVVTMGLHAHAQDPLSACRAMEEGFACLHEEGYDRPAQRSAERSGAERSRAEQSRAEQSRAEQSRAEQSRAEQSRAEQSRAERGMGGSHQQQGRMWGVAEAAQWCAPSQGFMIQRCCITHHRGADDSIASKGKQWHHNHALLCSGPSQGWSPCGH